MNNRGVSFFQYLVLLCIITAGIFLVFPDKVPLPLDAVPGMDMNKMAAAALAGPAAPAAPSLAGVKIQSIPQAVYDGIKDNSEYQEYLFGSKKRILLLTWNGCPYARNYRMGLDRAFMSPEIQAAYVKDIVVQPQSMYISCNSNHQNCPRVWLQRVCGEGICIINPRTRQIAVDNSQDAGRLTTLLDAYKNW